ncbi:response regulator transcription factor [Fusibacter ferrireducens]|nr:helix-turn-helix transcriptional regulator [Fusibacter ferrireducens]
MNDRKIVHVILSYGLFLSWLLSFLYNGSLLTIVFQNINIAFLAMIYIIVPAIVCYGFTFLPWQKYKAISWMKTSLIIAITGTFILLILNRFWPETYLMYIVAGVLGIFSVIFIAGWGVMFIKTIEYTDMFVVMAATICFSRVCIAINNTLSTLPQGKIGILFIFLSLIISYIYTIKFEPYSENPKGAVHVALDYKFILLISLIIFLTNVGGGLSQTLIKELTLKTFSGVYIVEGVLYAFFMHLIILKKQSLDKPIFALISLAIIGIGFLLLIIYNHAPTLSYLVVASGYLLLDMILWTLVAKVSFLFNEPFKVFFPVMGSNLIAVFLGNVLAMIFNDGWQKIYIAVSLCTIFTLLALPLYNALYGKLNALVEEARKRHWISESCLDIFTVKEREIVLLMLEGLKNKEVAERMFISENTLKTHAKNIYAKAEVSNKKELIEKYVSHMNPL